MCSASLSDGTREEMTEEELEEGVSSNSRASGDTQDGNGEQVKGHHKILLLMYNDVIFWIFQFKTPRSTPGLDPGEVRSISLTTVYLN